MEGETEYAEKEMLTDDSLHSKANIHFNFQWVVEVLCSTAKNSIVTPEL